MLVYVIRRVALTISLLIAVSVTTFFLMHAIPGGPFDVSPDFRHYDPVMKAQIEKAFGLDKPLWKQYFIYMGHAVRLDLGPSFAFQNRSVTSLLYEHFPFSARLGVQALCFAVLVGVPWGVVTALYRNSWINYASLTLATMGIAIPSFVLSLYLIIFFGNVLHLVSVIPSIAEYRTQFRPWVLPTIALGLPAASFLARHTHSAIIEVMQQDYIRTALAKGLQRRFVIQRHVIKNAMIPIWTIFGLLVIDLIAGSLIVERLFLIPGIGQYFINAISARDYSMIMGTTLFYAVIVVLFNLIVDITYSLFDPRISILK